MQRTSSGEAAAMVELASPLGFAIFDRLPPRPDASFDRVLDATERCVARYGLGRTSMSDIAREMRVARTTLYRQVSSLSEALALMASRQFHRRLDEFVELAAGGATVDTIVQVAARTVEFCQTNPVAVRILNHEPDVFGETFTGGQFQSTATQVIDALAPLFEAAMEAGTIRRTDPHLAAAWLVRVVTATVLLPGPASPEETVGFVLRPVLEPDAHSYGGSDDEGK